MAKMGFIVTDGKNDVKVYEHAEDIQAVPLRHPGRWVAVVLLGVLAAMLVNNLLTNPNYRWMTVGKYLFDKNIVKGVGFTLILAVASMIIAVVLGIILTIMRISGNPVLSGVAWVYLWLFRGTPVYTQLVFWGFLGALIDRIGIGIPFGPTFFETDTDNLITPFVAALFGLALNEAAYMAEIVRSGLLSVDQGQTEAASALGMGWGKSMSRIVLPQAMRIIVPPTGNEFISLLKTTSLVLAVPYTLELQFAANAIGNRLYTPIPLLIVAAIWYLFITSILMTGQFYVERYYGKGTNREQPPTPVQRIKSLLGGRGAGRPTKDFQTVPPSQAPRSGDASA